MVTSILVAAFLAQTPYDVTAAPSTVVHEIPANKGSAALWQILKKLKTRASLMMITAHPDDEDGGMLTYESRGRGTRVSLLTLNRGEGGANVMSPEFYDALGLVRTQELLAAGRYYGVNQYWTRVIDYGFSKTMDESMQHWTRERVLADAVRAVRMARPLVVTSVFVGGPSDGHGNHQTAGAMAREVMRAAADPAMFPEQGLRPWKPLKSYARMPRIVGGQFKVSVEVPIGEYDPVLGASYAQIAREGLGMQKSQNGGPNIPRAGTLTSAYHRFDWDGGKESGFFDGIDVSVKSLGIEEAVDEAIAKFSAAHPEASAPALAKGLRAVRASIASTTDPDVLFELKIKETQFNNALALSLGLSLTALVAPEQEPNPRMVAFMGEPETLRIATPGQSFGVRVYAVNQSGAAGVTLQSTSVESTQGPAWNVTKADDRFTVRVPEDAAYTKPYFTRPDLEQSYYDVSPPALVGESLAPYPLAGNAVWMYEGAPVRLSSYVQTVKRVNGLGTVFEPLLAGPAVGVKVPARFGIVPVGSKAFALETVVRGNVKNARGTVRLELPAGWTSSPATGNFVLGQEGEERTLTFTVTPGALAAGRSYKVTSVAEHAGRQYREGFDMTGYAGLRPYPLYRPATHTTSAVDVKVAPGLKIGYITGSGDEIPASLTQLGVKVDLLDPVNADLSKYDAVILGIRAYAARAELASSNQRLLDYVQGGGVVIVQYNTPEFDRNFGPFPYVMGNNPEEVTDESSKVKLLLPKHALLQWPNAITERDFEGWVEERGSKWMKSWDPRYEALLETNDAGQDPQRGGMLYAKHGKGVWVYAAWAFYRQLPEGVGGAYRLFANLISLPKNPGR
jgi:LmbE family N-acetylglucosaminyl deacetylase